jgi:hypothetical protein
MGCLKERLTRLHLYGHETDAFALETFPLALCQLTSLKYLVMDTHPFKEIPVEIARLTSLRELRVVHCEQLKRLPLSLASMYGVTLFNFMGSGVTMYRKLALSVASACEFRGCLRERFTREPRAAVEAVMLARLRDGNPWRSVPRDVARIIGGLLMRSAGEVVWHREDRPAVRRRRPRKRIKR